MAPRIGFLVIGVQKGGTSSLFEYLRRHPQIHMPAEKEIGYFNNPKVFERGSDWYRARVTRGAPPGSVCGEATPFYMSGTPHGDLVANEARDPVPNPGRTHEPLVDVIPRRIKECLPDVKLVCALRDPVTRAYSHHRMMVLQRAEPRPFDVAISELMDPEVLQRARVAPTRTNNYVVNGEYARILGGFLHVFPADQLLVIYSDHLAERPAETVAALYGFIGVAPDFAPDNLRVRYRATAEKERIPGLSLNRLQIRIERARAARSLWRALPDGARNRLDRIYTVAGYRLGMWNARRGTAGEPMSPTVRRDLIAHYRPDGEALGEMLSQSVPWLTAWNQSGVD